MSVNMRRYRKVAKLQPINDPTSGLENWENEGGALGEKQSRRLLSRMRNDKRYLVGADTVENLPNSRR
jgi:hypothetical protein